jgi:small subunit ribosomal protein S6
MTNYELMLIIDPSLSEDENKSVMESIRTTLTEESSKIIKEDIWGEKKLAYKIKKSEK